MKVYFEYFDTKFRQVTTTWSVIKTLREQINNPTANTPDVNPPKRKIHEETPEVLDNTTIPKKGSNTANTPDANPPKRNVHFNEETPKVLDNTTIPKQGSNFVKYYEIMPEKGGHFVKYPTKEPGAWLNDKKELLNSKPRVLFEDDDFEKGKLKEGIREQLSEMGYTPTEIQQKIEAYAVYSLTKECREIEKNPYLTKGQKEYVVSCRRILESPIANNTQKLDDLYMKSVDEVDVYTKIGPSAFEKFIQKVSAWVDQLVKPSKKKEEFDKFAQQADTAHVQVFNTFKEKYSLVTADIKPDPIDKHGLDEVQSTSFTKN